MENNGAEYLHIVGPLAERSSRRFPRKGEGFRQNTVQTFAALVPFSEQLCLARKFFRGQAGGPGFLFVNRV
jgi:hypothetical protein